MPSYLDKYRERYSTATPTGGTVSNPTLATQPTNYVDRYRSKYNPSYVTPTSDVPSYLQPKPTTMSIPSQTEAVPSYLQRFRTMYRPSTPTVTTIPTVQPAGMSIGKPASPQSTAVDLFMAKFKYGLLELMRNREVTPQGPRIPTNAPVQSRIPTIAPFSGGIGNYDAQGRFVNGDTSTFASRTEKIGEKLGQLFSGLGKIGSTALITGVGELEAATRIPIILDPTKSFAEKQKYIFEPVAMVGDDEKRTIAPAEGTITKSIAPGLEGLSQALTFNRYQPDFSLYKDTFGSQAMAVAGNIGGNLVTFDLLRAPIAAVTKSIPAVFNFAKQFPRTFRALNQGLVWATHGQLNETDQATISERAQKFAKDFTTGGLTGVIGEATGPIKGAKGYAAGAGSSFITGFGLAKLDGASDKDAVINGSLWAALNAVHRGFGEYKAPTEQKDEAIKTFNQLGKPFGVSLNANSTAPELDAAYKKLIRVYHPDVVGNGNIAPASTLNMARDMLLDKTGKVINPSDETIAQEWKRMLTAIKQGGVKKLPLGEINAAVDKATAVSPHAQEITKALNFSPGQNKILSQKFVNNVVDDLQPQVNAYIQNPTLKAEIVKNLQPLRNGQYNTIGDLVNAVNEALPTTTDQATRALMVGQSFGKSMGLVDPGSSKMMAEMIFAPKPVTTTTAPVVASKVPAVGEPLPSVITPAVKTEPAVTTEPEKPLTKSEQEQQRFAGLPDKLVLTQAVLRKGSPFKSIPPENLVHFNQGDKERVSLIVPANDKTAIEYGAKSKNFKKNSGVLRSLLTKVAQQQGTSERQAKEYAMKTYTTYRDLAKENAQAHHPVLLNMIPKVEAKPLPEVTAEPGVATPEPTAVTTTPTVAPKPLPTVEPTPISPTVPQEPIKAPEPTVMPKGIETPTKVAKAASSINQALVNKGFQALSEEQQAKFTPITKEATIKRVAELLTSDLELAKRIAIGAQEAPNDVQPQVLFNAVKAHAKEKDDIELMMQLAKSPIARERSEAAQTLSASGFNNDPEDPVTIMQDLVKVREKAIAKRTGTSIAKTKSQELKKLKVAIKPPKLDDWQEFLKSLEC